jgi:hypothetical protein
VFVSDNFNHVIGDSQTGIGRANVQFGVKISGFGPEPRSLNGIAGLSVDNDFLFVADSLNSRIQTMLINSGALNAGK